MNTLVKCSRQMMKLRNQPFLLPQAITTNLIPPPKFSKHIDSVRRLCSAAKRDIQNERKVCIVCTDSICSNWERLVYVVDLKWESDDVSCDESVTSMTPTVRFEANHFYQANVCVVGSTLYVFDGYHKLYNPRGGKSMYTYQLSDGISNLKLEKDMLSVGPAMHESKVDPKAVVAPNGKILVYSQTPTPHECDFELYDPVLREWQQLPSLRPSLTLWETSKFWINYFCIPSFTFMEGGNVLFVKTDLDLGTFTLDITAPNKVWKISGFDCAGALPYIESSFVLINNEICIVPYYCVAVDITKYEESKSGLVYDFPDLGYYGVHGDVVLLENQEAATKVFNVCFLDLGTNNETQDFEMVLQVYSCNLKECRKELLHRKYMQKKIEGHTNPFDVDRYELLPGTKKVKTLRIVVKTKGERSDAFQLSDGFHLYSYASIPPIQIACPESESESESEPPFLHSIA